MTKEEKEVQIHEKQNRLHQTFLQAKTFTKKMLMLSAAETVGNNLKSGATVVLESTVYPGVTEEVVAPINFRTRIKDDLRY